MDQSNFHDYQPLRINEMPRIEVHIVPSTTAPGEVRTIWPDGINWRSGKIVNESAAQSGFPMSTRP